MPTQLIDELKRRHSFASWRSRNKLSESLLVWRFFLSPDTFAGWRLQRSQPVATPGWPPAIHSYWIPERAGSEALLNADIFECSSRESAHEFLMTVLGDFQSPLVEGPVESAVGDVAFTGPGKSMFLFARANLVVRLRNGGREVVPVDDLSGRLDQELALRPERAERVVPEIQNFSPATPEPKAGARVPLRLEASDPLGRPLWFKFFSRTGDFEREEERVTYQALAAGPQEVTVFAINANRGHAKQTLRFVAG